ncbi:MAG: transporter substrate-binding domain-containing protein [Fusobacteriaceae bacterium]
MIKKSKNILKIIIILFTFSLITLSKEKPLIVGMELAYPPFEMTDSSGNPIGVSVDLAKELGLYLNREIKIENIAWSGLLPSLLTKKVDIILSSMTITEERKKAVAFSIPYAESYLSLLVNIDSPVNIPADLNNPKRTIVVKTGSTGHLVAKKYFPQAKLRILEKETLAVLEVSQGKADAFIYDPLTVIKNNTLNLKTTKIILDNFQIDKHGVWGIAYGKNDIELGNSINKFLEEFKEKKGFEPLIEKYLKNEKKIFDEKKIPFFFGN